MARLFTTQTPALPDVNEAINVTVGITLVFDTAGTVTGAWFYAPATLGAGTYEAAFWVMTRADGTTDIGLGTLLANAAFSSITPGAWNFVAFSSGVAVDSSHAYVMGLRTSEGRYTATGAFFASALVNGHITGVQDGSNPVGLGQLYDGRFVSSSITAFPNLTFNHNAYFVDVEFTAGGAAATTASPYVVTPAPVARPGQQILLRNTAALIVPPAKGTAPLVATRPTPVPPAAALLRRNTLVDPPVLTTVRPIVVTAPVVAGAASSILLRAPQAGAAPVSTTTPGPIVVTSTTRALPPSALVLRGSLADAPVLTTVAPLVVTSPAPPPAGAAIQLRNPQPAAAITSGPTTAPIVATAATPSRPGQALLIRSTLIDPPVLTTPAPLVITSQAAQPPGAAILARGSLADFYAGTVPLVVSRPSQAARGVAILVAAPQPQAAPTGTSSPNPELITRTGSRNLVTRTASRNLVTQTTSRNVEV